MIPLILPQIVVAAAVAFAWFFPYRGWHKDTHDLMQNLYDGVITDHPHITAGELKQAVAKLPNAIRKWIDAILPQNLSEYDDNTDIPFARSLRIDQKGTFLLNDKWINFTATQEFSTRSQSAGFVWDAEMVMMDCIGLKLPIHVRDAYVSGIGMLKAQMPFGLPVMKMDDSSELNEGELLRWCAEAVLFPLALVCMTKGKEENSMIKWHASEEDENIATLEFNHNDSNVRINFKFDPNNLVTSMFCMRPKMNGTVYEMARWEGYCYDYEGHGGILVPTRMEAGWKADKDKDVELYFKGENEHFIYGK